MMPSTAQRPSPDNDLCHSWRCLLLLPLLWLVLGGLAWAGEDIEGAYRFLVSGRDQGGILYTATAGKLKGRQLPLSFVDSADYWGLHVCTGADCAVVDEYDAQAFTLRPRPGLGGELQTERVNTHNGANIYDAATWQIALMLGQKRNGLSLPTGQDAYTLADNQNLLLQQGHFGDSPYPTAREIRGVSSGAVFIYNHEPVNDAARSFVFRMLPRRWLAEDPFLGTAYARYLTVKGLPPFTTDYRAGTLSWTDWKPITGENAWAFFIGPLQAATLHFQKDAAGYIPLHDPALDNALKVLPTFALMQSSLGGLYYAPAGTVANQGAELVDPSFISVENNLSVLAGLRILQQVLQTTRERQPGLSPSEQQRLDQALQLCQTMEKGGTIAGRRTEGLLAFLRQYAWLDGEFVQGGWADKPGSNVRWQPALTAKAVDVNTWGIAVLGAETIDKWFGFGAAQALWQRVRGWGGYGEGRNLWGVGFSNLDGNGIDEQGNFRQGVLSSEWSYGAITAVRELMAQYQRFTGKKAQVKLARRYVEELQRDEQSMLAAMERLQLSSYSADTQTPFPGQPAHFAQLLPLATNPSLYASRRHAIPFGWYANPLPSTCATAWRLMVANHFNPFQFKQRQP